MLDNSPMLKNIYLPHPLQGTHSTQVTQISAHRGDRIRRGQILLTIQKDGDLLEIPSEEAGWLRFVAVKIGQSIAAGDLLFIIDSVDMDGYRLDEQEVNPHTELGQLGRRGLERQGQEQIGKHAAALFDAPHESAGESRSVKTHPLLKDMKEGVPPKMADARNNSPAVDRFAEDAAHDPDLKPSPALQAELGITPGPSSAPSLTRG